MQAAPIPMTDDAFLDSLTGLRVTRAFTDEPVSGEDLGAILDAGRWTGSSKNRQGWVFVVIDDRPGLDAVASAGRFSAPVRKSTATVALVRTAEGNDFDIGRAAQSMMLAAAACGLGSCPVTLHDQQRAREVLDLPDDQECRWVIALGHPDREAEEVERNRRRRAGTTGRKLLHEVTRTWSND